MRNTAAGVALLAPPRCVPVSNAGSQVGAERNYCWACQDDLAMQNWKGFQGERWWRKEDELAARFPLRFPRKVLAHGVQVDPGMRAAIYVNGRLEEELGPGFHLQDDFLDRLTGKDVKGDEAKVVLAYSEPALVPVPAQKVATKDFLPVEVSLSLRVQFDGFAKLTAGALSTRDRLTVHELGELLANAAQRACRSVVGKISADELIGESAPEALLRDSLIAEAGPHLLDLGYQFEGVDLVEFGGSELLGRVDAQLRKKKRIEDREAKSAKPFTNSDWRKLKFRPT